MNAVGEKAEQTNRKVAEVRTLCNSAQTAARDALSSSATRKGADCVLLVTGEWNAVVAYALQKRVISLASSHRLTLRTCNCSEVRIVLGTLQCSSGYFFGSVVGLLHGQTYSSGQYINYFPS